MTNKLLLDIGTQMSCNTFFSIRLSFECCFRLFPEIVSIFEEKVDEIFLYIESLRFPDTNWNCLKKMLPLNFTQV